MSWVTVASIDTGGYGYTRLQYDDASTGESRSSRVIFELKPGASIYVYFNNFTVNGTNLGQKTVSGNCTLWTGSLPAGNRTVSYTCPWYSGTVNYSGTGYIPSGYSNPTELSVSIKSKTYNSAVFNVSISSYGTPGSTNGRYIEAAILGSSTYGNPYRYAKASNVTSAELTVDNSSSQGSTALTITGNTTYHYGAYANNTQRNISTVAGTFTTPCPPLSTLSLFSQTYKTYNTVNAVIDWTRQSDGGALARTLNYRYSTDGGTTYTAWTSAGTITASSGTFTASGIPTDKSVILQAKLTTTAGDSTVITTTFTTKTTHISPNFSNFDYADTNADAIALTGDSHALIQGQSTPVVTVSTSDKATGNDNVAISNYAISFSGSTYTLGYSSSSAVSQTLLAPSQNGTLALKVSAVDELSLSTAVSKDVTVYPWSAPTVVASAERTNGFESETTLKIHGTYAPIIVDNATKNTLTVQFRTKKSSESNWGNWQTRPNTPSGNNWSIQDYAITLDNNYQWDIQVKATDAFSSTTVDLVLTVGIPKFFIGEDGRCSVGRKPQVDKGQNNGQLEVEGDIISSGSVYAHNTAKLLEESELERLLPSIFLRTIYPIGSIYCSTTNKSPQQFLGGTWALEWSGKKYIKVASQVLYYGSTRNGSGTSKVIGAYQYSLIDGIFDRAPAMPSGFHQEYQLSGQVSSSGSNSVRIRLNNIQTDNKGTWSSDTFRQIVKSNFFKKEDITLETTLGYSNPGINLGIVNDGSGDARMWSATIHGFYVSNDTYYVWRRTA